MIYRVKESGMCPHCSVHQHHERHQNQSSSQQQSSATGQRRIVIPLKRKVIQNNQNIEQTLTLLQDEVNKLKQQNVGKDLKIKQLELQLIHNYDLPKNFPFNHQNIPTHNYHPSSIYTKKSPVNSGSQFGEFAEKQSSINQHIKFKIPLNLNYRSLMHNKNQDVVAYNKKATKKTERESQHRERDTKNFKSVSPTKTLNEIQFRIKQISDTKNERIRILSEQLEESQFAIQQLQERLQEQMAENQWMTRFCLSFIRMTSQIAKTQGHKVTDSSWPIRKNAKQSWKYLKQFLHQVIS